MLENPSFLRSGFTEISLNYVDLLRSVFAIYEDGREPGIEIKESLRILRQSISSSSHSALIVENSEVVVGLLKEIFKGFHFRIEIVDDGYVALGRWLSEPFDVVITSLETKRLNGLALIGAIQKSGVRSRKTKTILLTSTQVRKNGQMPDYVLHKDAELKEKLQKIVKQIAI